MRLRYSQRWTAILAIWRSILTSPTPKNCLLFPLWKFWARQGAVRSTQWSQCFPERCQCHTVEWKMATSIGLLGRGDCLFSNDRLESWARGNSSRTFQLCGSLSIYLRHILWYGSLVVASKPCDSVKRACLPTTQTDNRSFLGHCNAHSLFVPSLAPTSDPAIGTGRRTPRTNSSINNKSGDWTSSWINCLFYHLPQSLKEFGTSISSILRS